MCLYTPQELLVVFRKGIGAPKLNICRKKDCEDTLIQKRLSSFKMHNCVPSSQLNVIATNNLETNCLGFFGGRQAGRIWKLCELAEVLILHERIAFDTIKMFIRILLEELLMLNILIQFLDNG